MTFATWAYSTTLYNVLNDTFQALISFIVPISFKDPLTVWHTLESYLGRLTDIGSITEINLQDTNREQKLYKT